MKLAKVHIPDDFIADSVVFASVFEGIIIALFATPPCATRNRTADRLVISTICRKYAIIYEI